MRPLVVLPKAHLRLHLAAAMRPSTLVELAEAGGLAVAASFDVAIAPGSTTQATPDDVLTSAAALQRLVAEVVADAAAAGAVWIEPTLDPQRFADRLGGAAAVLEVVLEALALAGARHGVGTGLVVAASRAEDPALALARARLAVRHAADGVVGFALLAAPGGPPLAAHSAAFATARAGGLLALPHLDPADGPEGVASAVGDLGADRIGDGAAAAADPDLVVRLAGAGTCLDLAPASDVAERRVGALADHPATDLLDAGVRCSLNAPHPLRTGIGLLDEFEAARHRLAVDDVHLALLARTSLAASGAPDALKARADEGVEAWLAAHLGAAVA